MLRCVDCGKPIPDNHYMIKCEDCFKKGMEKIANDKIKDDSPLVSRMYIFCPYCGNLHVPDLAEGDYTEGIVHKTCKKCGKEYRSITKKYYEFISDRFEEDETD